jgi:hypothetical protein
MRQNAAIAVVVYASETRRQSCKMRRNVSPSDTQVLMSDSVSQMAAEHSGNQLSVIFAPLFPPVALVPSDYRNDRCIYLHLGGPALIGGRCSRGAAGVPAIVYAESVLQHSPGLSAFSGLPWVYGRAKETNPAGVQSQMLRSPYSARPAQLLQSCRNSMILIPRVVRQRADNPERRCVTPDGVIPCTINAASRELSNIRFDYDTIFPALSPFFLNQENGSKAWGQTPQSSQRRSNLPPQTRIPSSTSSC